MLAEKTALPAGVVVGARPVRGKAVIVEQGATVIEGEEVEIDGAMPAPEVSTSRPRSSTRRAAPAQSRPKAKVVRPADDDYYDDLDPIPDAAPAPAPRTRPKTTNEEDLPTAAPDPAPKAESKPRAKPAPKLPDDVDDEIPSLDAPR
jgi:hypothetical protein